MDTGAQTWDKVITPKRRWWNLRLKELWRYRTLIAMFVRRDFVTFYKQTILGPLWYIIQPIMNSIVYAVIFGSIAGLSTDGLPAYLFYLSGTVIWSYFAECLRKTSRTFLDNRNIFDKVYFPRLATSISIVLSNLIGFVIQFSTFLCFLVYFLVKGAAVQPGIWMLALPILLLIMAALGLGLGLIVSALTTKYRDLQFVVGFGVQLLMYATPVIYPMSSIPEPFARFIYLNPLAPIVEAFRYAFLGVGTVSWGNLAYSGVLTVVILWIGLLLFHRVESTFMDTV